MAHLSIKGCLANAYVMLIVASPTLFAFIPAQYGHLLIRLSPSLNLSVLVTTGIGQKCPLQKPEKSCPGRLTDALLFAHFPIVPLVIFCPPFCTNFLLGESPDPNFSIVQKPGHMRRAANILSGENLQGAIADLCPP